MLPDPVVKRSARVYEQQIPPTKSLEDVMQQCTGHFLYKPLLELPPLTEFVGQYIEVRIES